MSYYPQSTESIMDRILDINSQEIRSRLTTNVNTILQILTDRKKQPVDIKVETLLKMFFPYMEGRLNDPLKRDAYARILMDRSTQIILKLEEEKSRLTRQYADEFAISDTYFCAIIEDLIGCILDQPGLLRWLPVQHGRIIEIIHDILHLSSLIHHDSASDAYKTIASKIQDLSDSILEKNETDVILEDPSNIILSLIEIRFLMNRRRVQMIAHKTKAFI